MEIQKKKHKQRADLPLHAPRTKDTPVYDVQTPPSRWAAAAISVRVRCTDANGFWRCTKKTKKNTHPSHPPPPHAVKRRPLSPQLPRNIHLPRTTPFPTPDYSKKNNKPLTADGSVGLISHTAPTPPSLFSIQCNLVAVFSCVFVPFVCACFYLPNMFHPLGSSPSSPGKKKKKNKKRCRPTLPRAC